MSCYELHLVYLSQRGYIQEEATTPPYNFHQRIRDLHSTRFHRLLVFHTHSLSNEPHY